MVVTTPFVSFGMLIGALFECSWYTALREEHDRLGFRHADRKRLRDLWNTFWVRAINVLSTRMENPTNVPLPLHELCLQCLRNDPNSRPTAATAETLLGSLLQCSDLGLQRLMLGYVPSTAR